MRTPLCLFTVFSSPVYLEFPGGGFSLSHPEFIELDWNGSQFTKFPSGQACSTPFCSGNGHMLIVTGLNTAHIRALIPHPQGTKNLSFKLITTTQLQLLNEEKHVGEHEIIKQEKNSQCFHPKIITVKHLQRFVCSWNISQKWSLEVSPGQ